MFTKIDSTFSILFNRYLKNSPIHLIDNDEKQAHADKEAGTLRVNYSKRNDFFLLSHEMAHLVEIEEHRLFMDNFGLKDDQGWTKKLTKLGPSVREMRVFSFQINLCERLGINKEQIESLKRSIPGAISSGLFSDHNFIPGNNHFEKKRWVEDTFNECLKIYSFEEFEARWETRMKKLWNIFNEAQAKKNPPHSSPVENMALAA